MTWEKVYLLCFLVGLAMSALSFLLGSLEVHLPHIHLDGFHAGHHGGAFHVGHIHLDHGNIGVAHGAAGADAEHAPGARQFGVSPINFSTLMAFLAWFGGAGFLLTHYSRATGMAVLALSLLAGMAGSSVVFFFMAKVLVRADENLDPADYEMVGALGRLTVAIRDGGTGEIVYVQGGTRKTAAARSEAGPPIAKGTEVVVTKYEKGIAYVRRWDELAGDDLRPAAHAAADQETGSNSAMGGTDRG